MKKIHLIIAIVLMFHLILSNTASAKDAIMVKKPTVRGHDHVPGEIVVKFKPGVSGKAIAAINAAHGTSEIYTSPFAGFKRLKVPKNKTASEMMQIYSRNPNVEYAELNYIAYALWVPNDVLYSYQWHLDNPAYGGIDMEQAWELADGTDVIVAVIDTGVARGTDLADTSFVPGWDFVNDDDDPTDDEGHGTHVTGTIAQSTNNVTGVAGVAFGCSIMPVKVLNSSGSGTYTDIADGIYYATDNGADVINMSLGGRFRSTTLKNAVAYAYNNDVTVVCASGNDGSKRRISYPAAYDDYCIAVGATTYNEQVAYYSNQGTSLDLTAPGGDVTADLNNDGYVDGVLQQTFDAYYGWGYFFYQGTSMAAPHASGVAALLISNDVAVTPDEVREVLQSTAEDKGASGWDSKYGYGIVNAYAALSWNPGTPPAPMADFLADPTSGAAPLTVNFTDSSTGDITDWSWDFGNGTTSTGQNPVCVYEAGTYTVSLTVTGLGGSDTETKTEYIVVTEEPSPGSGMHVSDIDMSLKTKNAGRHVFVRALATVTILDADQNPVEGAMVYSSWSNATTDVDSGLTDANGSVTLESDQLKNPATGTTFTFTVDDVTKSGWTYDAGETSASITY